MSKIVYVCSRNGLPVTAEQRVREVCNRLEPDNIVARPARVVRHGNNIYGVVNPSPSMLERDGSVVIGHLLGDASRRESALSHGHPDGSYALFRDSGDRLEVMSDPAGSRTVWYYQDEETFIASTSQRAIVAFVGSFQFNEQVIPWVLSTGSLGPSLSWDRRIEMLPSDSSVVLDKRDWSVSIKTTPIDFTPQDQPDAQHERMLREALEETIQSLDLDLTKWVLALSGGYDSRSILYMLRDAGKDIDPLRTVTWGLASRRAREGNDAAVAKELAGIIGVSNEYYPTDLTSEPIDLVLDRFVRLGEGRVDHLSGYMDGFAMWKAMFEDGVHGLIRGDEGLGWDKPKLPLDSAVRIGVGCAPCSDFRNFQGYGLAAQELPPSLLKEKGETLAAWRDRLYHQFRLPTIISALSDLRLAYVEQASPLLFRKVLLAVRQLPDALRTDKILFRSIVGAMSPRVHFASSGAIASPQQILREDRIVNLLKEDISSQGIMQMVSPELVDQIVQRLETGSFRASRLDTQLRRIKRLLLGAEVDYNVLAFRVFIISRMNTLMNQDSCASTNRSGGG